jgi:hypothetical protein
MAHSHDTTPDASTSALRDGPILVNEDHGCVVHHRFSVTMKRMLMLTVPSFDHV